MATIQNKIIRGSFGRLWINGLQVAQVKSFELKATLNYEEVDVNGDLAKKQRYTGYALAGTMVCHKINSYNTTLVNSGIKNGQLPDIKFVATLADPDSEGSESIEVYDVTFDEVTLMHFENASVEEESIPFKAGGYDLISSID